MLGDFNALLFFAIVTLLPKFAKGLLNVVCEKLCQFEKDIYKNFMNRNILEPMYEREMQIVYHFISSP